MPEQPQVTFPVTPVVRKRLINQAQAMPPRFTLDQFAEKWYHTTGMTGLDFCKNALDWLQATGVVKRDGLMHWRRV